MPINIPINSKYANFSIDVSLEDTTYRFSFIWNTRAEQWVLDIFDISLNPIVTSIAMVLNINLFDQFTYTSLPKGQLFLIDTSISDGEITRTNFGESIKLIYVLEEEIDTI